LICDLLERFEDDVFSWDITVGQAANPLLGDLRTRMETLALNRCQGVLPDSQLDVQRVYVPEAVSEYLI
jgi:hypothetical protein